jgi:hypothetical protein
MLKREDVSSGKIASTRYAVEEAIRLSKQPGTWESKARTMNVASWEEIAARSRARRTAER